MKRKAQTFNFTPKPLQAPVKMYEQDVFEIQQEVLNEKQLNHHHLDHLEEVVQSVVQELLERIWDLEVIPTETELEEIYEQTFGYFSDFVERKLRERHYFRIHVNPDVLERLQELTNWFFQTIEGNL